MKISFVLNGEPVEIDTMPHRRTLDLLRESFQIRSIYYRCNNRGCGLCLILLDGNPMHSCLIPAFELRLRDIWTMEGISARKEFEDLVAGFELANAKLCSFCAPSRALVAEALLKSALNPDMKQLRFTAEAVKCSCNSTLRIIDGLEKAAEFRRERLRVSKV
ncbi:hypothetical protein S1OALGB6SA_1882 [Olavius algarvensis spirochete endosymbiont]|uniref:(2Fe-2S)-binding protein n=1 Tax=Olavius algarvensis spirochete endosymbiont TaxID=260710 RepID=UPI000F256ACA|nr:2Fe-2S iron-sulfur cluster-binding protein [Olavius algarvensis spirochete endosymbiont]CAD7842190.1 MAG: hypothetical protein [Olavius algarvensis spirochete endosymbiont]VDB00792.1 hypothetical protein S1OALGB6SA_1882 [Olavius algarvensis spirochete endosymbiont]